jgi:hypothetical protein
MRGWSPGPFLVLVFVLVVVAAGPASGLSPGAAPGGAADTDGEQYGSPFQGEGVDQVAIGVAIQPDGSAVWHVEHRIRLDDDATTQGFEETRSRIETDREAFVANFTEGVRAMATAAESDTGRVMVVENVSVTASREQFPQEYGIITYEFRWYGFARADGDLRAGDALAGLFLNGETTLLVSWPDNVTLAEVSPEPDDRRDGAVVWDGPLEFAPGEPTVVLESESLSLGPDLVWDRSSSDPFLTLGVLVFLVGLVGLGGVVLRRRVDWDRSDDGESAEDAPDDGESAEDASDDGESAEDASDDGESAEDASDDGESAEDASDDGESAEDASDDGESAGGAPDDGTTTGEDEEVTDTSSVVDSDIPEELLSNEERVLALLEAEGGRLKQQEVVEELDWSETKTSEVVTELRETDQIEVYRIGRNNVLALPDTGIGYEFDHKNGGEEG